MFQETLGYFKHMTAIEMVDIALVLLIIFQMFRALRGSIAFNIFIGGLVIYVLWLLVKKLEMPLMSEMLDRLVSIGLIGLLVVFQPEIRKFLIVLGRRSPLGKNGFISRLFQANTLNKYIVEEDVIDEIANALKFFQEKKLGAIIVIAHSERFEFDTNTGNIINGTVSAKLLESIFSKSSPLHDGAVIIDRNNLIAAGIVLPISDSAELPSHIGLRHRSAVGASEHNDVLVIVVSEESGKLAIAYQGKLQIGVPIEEVKKEMYNAMTS
ncbi:MAG: DNA integrity scanning protein DisA nucleotide-binding domain protein [Bacteroidetes bacterium]|nr:DNA integrity scanning protein DisA nucleotide-binding domain protein [Bacteroidota bacterium]MBK8144472.1 DNA integrity scanning protein DisA nucleotide-binding domain protein [Bacteroidota bacterium]MBP6316326.1 diadenylate cyclase [Chitinophagaceae bacterium]